MSPIIHMTMTMTWARLEILPMLLAILAVILVDSKTKQIVKSQHITRLPGNTENIYWYLKEKKTMT